MEQPFGYKMAPQKPNGRASGTGSARAPSSVTYGAQSVAMTPSPMPLLESDLRRSQSVGPVKAFPQRQRSGVTPSPYDFDDATHCSHRSGRHSCAACAVGANVSVMSFGIIPPEVATKALDSPNTAWRKELHAPIVLNSNAPKGHSVTSRRTKSAQSSPDRGSLRSEVTPYGSGGMVDMSYDHGSVDSTATGILNIEMIATPTHNSAGYKSFSEWPASDTK